MINTRVSKKGFESKMFDVITVGSATVDVFAQTESELITIKTAHGEEERIAYPSGTKILIKHLHFDIGGGGTNTAVSFSRMGLKTAYLGNLGGDDNAKKVLDLLKSEKITFIGCKDDGQTGYSIILDSIDNDRTILTNKGSNNNLLFENIRKDKLNTRWFYFSSMMGKSLVTMKKLSEHATKNGSRIAFNPSNYLITEDVSSVKYILKRTEILVYNKEEAMLLCGELSMRDLLIKSRELGPKIVVITDGKRGCCAFDGKDHYSIRPNKVKVIESTGAGDSFASGFLSGLIKGLDIKDSLRIGMANAESVITHLGAKEVLLGFRKALKNAKDLEVEVTR